MNKIFLIGNLTRDPETQDKNKDIPMCKFTIAVQRKFKNANNEYDVDFFNCTAWRKLATNIAEYCKKGNKIALVGSVQLNKGKDRNGNDRIYTEINAEEVEFLTPKNSSVSAPEKPKLEEFTDDDDIPF